MDLKKYVDRRKFGVFVMVSELLERAEERRDGHEKKRGTVNSFAWQYRCESGE